ncbi:TPA: hypothetical protein ACF35N_003083 [Vibrio parahaemolyticus]|uniref:hypothetical protein n=1 Tax=Vibrio parahaemolyticus TaxID=670 RepID=UPI0011237D30|nr:hypothetical protein [Vibrio parahaemolyticus]EGQ9297303.1 hypothetical protein [Vibrio parahaemolyticus]EGR1734740.1 hypothetical protein [Vibrio parahaemolyticus]TNZ89048.1 hypothetical protein CGK38_13565 [Vibrio parahaemolyticus]
MSYTVIDKYRLLVRRLGFNTSRKLLSAKLGFSAQGVEPFETKITEALASDPTVENKIDDIWHNVIFGGDKLVKVYRDVNASKFNTIEQHFSNLPNSTHDYATSFPFPVDESTLSSSSVNDLVVCTYKTEVLSSTRTIKAAVLSNKAFFTKTEPLSRSELSSSGTALLDQGIELFCKRRVSTQCFHVVILDTSTRDIFVSVDVTALPNSEAGREFMRLYNYFRDEVGANLRDHSELFPAVSALYDEVDDGRIHSVSFVTDDGNTDTIKLPSYSSSGCVKDDQYHAAGEVAASTLSKFKITKLWDLNEIPMGVELNGKRAMLLGSGGLDKLRVYNCTKLKENIHVLDKVLEHV